MSPVLVVAFKNTVISPLRQACIEGACASPMKIFCFILILSLLLPLQSFSAEGSSNLKHVSVQLKWRHQYQFAGYYVAKELGYYENAGLDVELIERAAQENATPIDKLMGGRVDFAVADSGALLYRSAGVPLVALAAVFQHSPSVLISLGNVTELTQLRHKHVMLGGGYMNAELLTMLQKAGVSTDDINIVPTIASIDELIQGRTDSYNGYTTNEPFVLGQRGVDFNVFRPKDFGVDFYGDILISTEATIERDPQMVKAFRDASLQGWKYAVEHPEVVVDLILDKYNTQGKNREHLLFEAKESNQLVFSEIVPIGYMNKERWQRIESIFRQHGLLKTPVDYERFLYDDVPSGQLMDILAQYRMQIAAGLVLLFGLMILLHNVHLRRQVALRTQELDEARIQAEIEARTDALTSLPNRRYFFESLDQYIGQAERRGLGLSMISMDLDHFKQINDTYGHAVGDAALIETAKLLSEHIRKGDVVARLGGEEFSIVCLDTDEASTGYLAERILEGIRAQEIRYGGQFFQCTVSIGIALWQHGDSAEELLKKSDKAMYEAKSNGRNQIKIWAASSD